ncbi:excinuclease ABC subunit UvrA [Nesterenkonia sp. E16_7]|uniref:ATP-binding cassette domain-containing protein n=1 Tax=unclassified Nesterenkonia TaxID=2629769 RepID=UPI001A91772B|nr:MULTISPECIES: excinuclease ABC subunit UvrA [unclassified Nesterenkonia]MBO0596921.1 excinuclease ABC subunit UvrA [Nesterenkonia sp. E16_10]MBO0598125.1 excinuclease ABC subunit UvrA [Nesterenkonia sp. E16_7]
MNDPARHHDVIEVIGARENNLKGFSLRIPKRALTVFTGVAGSGKSSLVFGTIAAESQRMINETYSAFLQGFMPSLSRPEVEDLQGLTAAIVVNQERLGANIRSTVGTVTDVNTLLRILFSRIGEPKIGSPQAFSFNVASISGAGAVTFERGGEKTKERREFSITGGMCPRCEGRGQINDIDVAQLIDESLSLNSGAITVPGYKAGGWSVRYYSESGFFDPDKPVRDYTEQERHDLLHREPEKVKMSGINMTYQGLVPQVRKSMLAKDRDAMQPHIRAFVDRAVTFVSCPACEGTRLSELARSVRVQDRNIAEVCAMQLSDLAEWLRALEAPAVAPLRASLLETVEHFIDIGLGYLSLDRPAGTLSGGEAQRVKMIRHLGSALTDITYVFDEPTIGLHPHDIDRMNTMLLRLRDKGNTVLVVEHKPETIEIADHVVDLGPRAGEAGGELCFEGTVAGLHGSDTLTGRHLGYRAQVKDRVRSATGAIEIRGARRNNLREVDVDIPTGVLTVITGVAGSGKSTLIEGSLAGREDVTFIDQSGIKGSSRSNPATYTGLLEPIRKAFAKANGVKPALFSANSEGACPTCGGAGVIYTELGVMETVASPCEDCEGRRFRREVLEYTLGDGDGDADADADAAGTGDGHPAGGRAALNISQVLSLSVDQAVEFFSAGSSRLPAATKILTRLADVGLGYLRLGQPLNTLSGGERQRIKLATKMADPGGVYVLDEPTTGLHLADVENLLGLLDRLVDSGTSVVVIEHHQAVMAHADWIIDLGPGAGTEGGQVVFTGTPAQLIAQGQTLTAEHLGRYVAG